jgi:small subunit ribosomal protein S6
MKPYETTIIFDPQLQEEGWEKAIEKYAGIITSKGEIKRTDRWGLRRLAYQIKKQTQGYYVQFIHESPPEIPREIERQCILDEACLRYLTVVGDNPRYLEEKEKRNAAREAAAAATEEKEVAAPSEASKTEEPERAEPEEPKVSKDKTTGGDKEITV